MNPLMNPKTRLPLIVLLFLIYADANAQDLYTARGYWEEYSKTTYQSIKAKQSRADSLRTDELAFLVDYEQYLQSYFEKLTPAEKQEFASKKDEWDRERARNNENKEGQVVLSASEEFDWRTRDRLLNLFYGIYYGTTIAALTDSDDAAIIGIPLITGGAWLMGPVINPKKYEGITQTTIRASNTGKMLGLLYGGSLGLALTGKEVDGELLLALSSAGSIALGEVGFQLQKRRPISEGHVEMIRHYGFLGPWLGATVSLAAADDPSNPALGFSLLGGGIAGIAIGNGVAKAYDYSRGDVDVVSSLTWISTGLGFAAVSALVDDNESSNGLILIPALGSIAGTVFGQKMVRGVHLTHKQGSVVNLAAGGSAVIGLGILALAEAEGPGVWFGVPSALALAAHQISFSAFKKKNLMGQMQSSRLSRKFGLSLKVMPENYLINDHIGSREKHFSTASINPTMISNPVVSLKLLIK